jgi:DNA mismatch repair ATPase MutS
VVEQLVDELENALEVIKNGKDRGMQLIFAKFDSMRSVWSLISQASALLDALGALAEIASSAGFVRPTILNCSVGGSPIINIVKGRHPCVESTYSGGAFIPNDLYIGDANKPRVLLLSGPNMVSYTFVGYPGIEYAENLMSYLLSV